MKKPVIILLCVSLSMAFLGFIIVAATGFKLPYSKCSTGNVYSKAVVVSENINTSQCDTIRLGMVNSELKIQKVPGNVIKLTYEKYSDSDWDYNFSGSTLSLKRHTKDTFWDWFRFFDDEEKLNHKSNVTLQIPEQAVLSYKINDVNGSAEITGISLKDIDAEMVNSTYRFEQVTCKESASLKNVNGSFQINKSVMESLSFDNMVNSGCDISDSKINSIEAKDFVNGHLKMTGLSDPDSYRVKYDLVNGSLDFNGESYKGSGKIGISKADKTVDFKGVNSDLTLDFSKGV